MTALSVSLPWPPETLLLALEAGQPRSGPAVRAGSDYNSQSCGVAALFGAGSVAWPAGAGLSVRVVLHQPTGVGRVWPPAILKDALRPALRGLAAALPIRTGGWAVTYEAGPCRPGGAVEVVLEGVS